MPNNSCGISVDAIKGIAVFKIGNKLFSLDLDYLAAFISPKESSNGMVSILTGEKAVMYNKDFYTLIDLHAFYGLPLKPVNDDTQLIVFESGGNKGAFYADSVEEIITFTRMVKDAIKIVPHSNGAFTAGEMVIDDMVLTIPDFKNIFASLKN